jgi:hypothetical protein
MMLMSAYANEALKDTAYMDQMMLMSLIMGRFLLWKSRASETGT